MNRRELLLSGAAATAALAAGPAAAEQPKEIVVGAIYPFSGPSGQIGVDAQHAFNTAADIVNGVYKDKALDGLPLANSDTGGLPGLGGAKIKLVFADHQSDPQKGRAEAERLVTQQKVCALIGSYQSSVAVTISTVANRYQVPYLSADNSSPTLHRRELPFYFRPGAHDEMFSKAMFDFFDALSADKRPKTLALFHEDTIFGTDSAAAQTTLAKERGYQIVADIKYRANSPSLTAEVQQLKAANADVLMPSSYTTDGILLVKTMEELGYKPRNIVAQDAGFAEQALYDAVGKNVYGLISRGSFSLDLAGTRPMIGVVNKLFRDKSGKDLNDYSSRQFMALIVLAEAINRAQSIDGEAIRKALTDTNLEREQTIMPWTRVKFNAAGQNEYADPVLLQWTRDESGKSIGKFVTVFPKEIAVREAAWPMNQG
jgi:branched-chain amino acid transport system substrate-binding protein